MAKVRNVNRSNKLKLNNRAFALITVLIFSSAMLILGVSVYYFIIQGTKFSGVVKRYSSLKEAAEGGSKLGIEMIKNFNKNFDDIYSGLKINSVSGEDCGLAGDINFDEYVILVNPESDNYEDCLNSISKQPWVTFTSGDFKINIYITKLAQGAMAGAGGAAAFPANYGDNVLKYKYLFKIVSHVRDTKNDTILITESLYRFVPE
jgi:hypothetical protein